jgi:hypothetical protein
MPSANTSARDFKNSFIAITHLRFQLIEFRNCSSGRFNLIKGLITAQVEHEELLEAIYGLSGHRDTALGHVAMGNSRPLTLCCFVIGTF